MRHSTIECDVCRREIRPALDGKEHHPRLTVELRGSVPHTREFDLCAEHAAALFDWLQPRVDILGRPLRHPTELVS